MRGVSVAEMGRVRGGGEAMAVVCGLFDGEEIAGTCSLIDGEVSAEEDFRRGLGLQKQRRKTVVRQAIVTSELKRFEMA